MASSADNAPRPIVIRRVKKVVGGGHHGGAWKVAYADFVTAMMAFFLLLWLISNPDKERLKGLAEYFSPAPPSAPAATGQTSGTTSVTAAGGHTMRAQSDAREGRGEPGMLAASPGVARGGSADLANDALRLTAEELKLALDATIQDADARVRIERDGDTLRVTITDNDHQSMFKNGSAELLPWGRLVLKRVAEKLRGRNFLVQIEGHTDGDGSGSDANMALASARTRTARQTLSTDGMGLGQIRALTAYADQRPLFTGMPERTENRRLTFVLLSPTAPLPNSADFAF